VLRTLYFLANLLSTDSRVDKWLLIGCNTWDGFSGMRSNTWYRSVEL
jgi:hypothetical protein